MRIAAEWVPDAPIEDVWSIVTDPGRVLAYISGVTRWEVASGVSTGLGAPYRMLFRRGRPRSVAWLGWSSSTRRATSPRRR